MTTISRPNASDPHPDDIAVWPDGTWATLGDIWRGDYGFMSDDYEVVWLEDVTRLKQLDIDI